MLTIVKIYSWKGITRTGEACRGKELVSNIEQLQQILYRQDISIKCIHRQWIIYSNKQVKTKEIFLFTRQISRLLAAGLSLIQILELLASSVKNIALKHYFIKLIINIENGYSLTEALGKNQAYFSKFHCKLIALGEKTASLGLMFDRIAIHLEKQMKLKAKITNALIYPIVVLLVASLVFIALLMGVVPQFQQLFSEVGVQLPLMTRMMIALSKSIGSLSIFVVVSLLNCSIFFIFLNKKYLFFKKIVDNLYVNLPIINKFLAKVIAARISRALSIALAAGLPLLDALQLVAEMTDNYVFKSAILISCERICNGEGFYQALSKQKVLPADLLQLIKVGEFANCLSEILNNAADLYEEQINYFVDNLSVLLEPVLIIILGLMVGVLITSMYLPIFKLGSII